MTPMRHVRPAWAVLAITIAALSAAPARADFAPIPQPNAAYVTGTSLLSFSDPDLSVVASLSSGPVTVTPDIPLVALTVPGTWTAWGAPPNTEGATPRVLWTNGLTSLTLKSSVLLNTFGLEAQPNTTVPAAITATFFLDNTQVGQIVQAVDGNAGARLFAGTSLSGFNRVVLDSTDDFAVARIRVAAVPEPGQVVQLVTVGAFGLAAWLYRAWRQTPPA
jgi:hypothetical protein